MHEDSMTRDGSLTGGKRRPERIVLMWLLAVFYFYAGVKHIQSPALFLAITPNWVPMPELVVLFTGIAEILGAIGLVQPWSRVLRRSAGIGLAVYAVCVFPANINHMIMDMSSAEPQLGWAYHAPRMVAQPIFVWLALWVSNVIDWPFKKQP